MMLFTIIMFKPVSSLSGQQIINLTFFVYRSH